MKDCTVCMVEDWITAKLRAEGCRLADFDAPAVIMARLFGVGVRAEDVRADSVDSLVFWRAVYGPAYPALVTA